MRDIKPLICQPSNSAWPINPPPSLVECCSSLVNRHCNRELELKLFFTDILMTFKDKQERPESVQVGEPGRSGLLREQKLYLVLMCNASAVMPLELQH